MGRDFGYREKMIKLLRELYSEKQKSFIIVYRKMQNIMETNFMIITIENIDEYVGILRKQYNGNLISKDKKVHIVAIAPFIKISLSDEEKVQNMKKFLNKKGQEK